MSKHKLTLNQLVHKHHGYITRPNPEYAKVYDYKTSWDDEDDGDAFLDECPDHGIKIIKSEYEFVGGILRLFICVA